MTFVLVIKTQINIGYIILTTVEFLLKEIIYFDKAYYYIKKDLKP